ncbi:MAG: hypothetical protein FWG35_07025 [Spirochaetaceae bacterium]|nr:hypothetical protein [Spirochaetaceae bacterium]
MESFLALDNGEALPPELADHRAGCSRCAREADELLALMRTRAVFAEIPPPRDITPAVMARIGEKKAFAENRLLLSTINWVSVGLLILLGMFLIPFSTILPGLSRATPWIDLALPLVLGFVVTIYASFFTGSHMKVLSRFLRLHS